MTSQPLAERDEYGVALDNLLATYQSSAHRTYEREAAEQDAATENAVREFAAHEAMMNDLVARRLVRRY